MKPCHNDTLEKNYDHTIFDARTMFVQSLHVRDVNILVIRDFLCILHNILSQRLIRHQKWKMFSNFDDVSVKIWFYILYKYG